MLGWRDDLSEWLEPFLARLGDKARRRMCPLYVAGLIGPGDRKSVGPTRCWRVRHGGRSAGGAAQEVG